MPPVMQTSNSPIIIMKMIKIKKVHSDTNNVNRNVFFCITVIKYDVIFRLL